MIETIRYWSNTTKLFVLTVAVIVSLLAWNIASTTNSVITPIGNNLIAATAEKNLVISETK